MYMRSSARMPEDLTIAVADHPFPRQINPLGRVYRSWSRTRGLRRTVWCLPGTRNCQRCRVEAGVHGEAEGAVCDTSVELSWWRARSARATAPSRRSSARHVQDDPRTRIVQLSTAQVAGRSARAQEGRRSDDGSALISHAGSTRWVTRHSPPIPGPSETLRVVGIAFDVYLLVSGVFPEAATFGAHVPAHLRALHFITGALCVLLGLVCFRGRPGIEPAARALDRLRVAAARCHDDGGRDVRP